MHFSKVVLRGQESIDEGIKTLSETKVRNRGPAYNCEIVIIHAHTGTVYSISHKFMEKWKNTAKKHFNGDRIPFLWIPKPMDYSLPGSSVGGISWQEYWSGYPFPSGNGSNPDQDQTQVSCIAGRFFTIWSTREAPRIPFLWILKTEVFLYQQDQLPWLLHKSEDIHPLQCQRTQGVTYISLIPAWRIPWTEEPGGLQSMGLQRVGHDWAMEHTHACSWSLTAISPLVCASHRHCLIWFTKQPHEGADSGVFISLLIVQRKPYCRMHLVSSTWIWAPKEERTSNLWFVYFTLV